MKQGDDALLDGCAELTDLTLEAFRARPTEESMPESVSHVLAHVVGHPAFDRAFALERLAQSSAPVQRVLLEFQHRQGETVERALRERFGPDADPMEVAVKAACVAGLLHRVNRLLVEDYPDGPDTDTALRVYAEAFDILFTRIGEGVH